MKYRTLGKTGLCVSEISFSTRAIGGDYLNDGALRRPPTRDQVETVLRSALNQGINFIETDTAYEYGDVIAELLLDIHRSDVIIASKVGKHLDGLSGDDFSYQAVTASIDQSLRDLKTEYLDVVQLNNPSVEVLRQGEAERALLAAQAAGKIRFTGVSTDGTTALYALVNGHFEVLQTDFHTLDASAAKITLPLANQLGVGVLVRSEPPRGIYTSHPSGQQPPDAIRDQVDKVWRIIAADTGRKPDVADYDCLREHTVRFALKHPFVHSALIAGASQAHLVQNELTPMSNELFAALLAAAEGADSRSRCGWADSPLLIEYHDYEWGTTPDGDAKWFEFIVLETFQAGLSWKTILNKRKAFREAFHGFDVHTVAQFDESDLVRLMGDASIVRNQSKIRAAVENAKIAEGLIREFGSLEAFMRFQVGRSDKPLDMLCRTFRFVGRTTAESIVYATGLVAAPHDEQCFKAVVDAH